MSGPGNAPSDTGHGRATAEASQRRAVTSSTLSTGAFTLRAGSGAYGRHVSSAMDRAAVFTSEPQAVEVYQSGSWWPGELLGWRHDDSGLCQVWVRVVLGGLEESAWTDLSTLRLPERHLTVAAGLSLDAGPATRAMPAARSTAALRAVSTGDDPSETVILPMVRERSANHPAGGRRRAPETGAMPAQAPAAPAATSPRGRHRAAAAVADPGRHRAADTGLFAAVAANEPAVADGPRGGRSAAPAAGRPVKGWTPPAGLDPDLLTRPMRLSDSAPHGRRPRLNGSLSSV
jgi:hypothetical protein